VDKFKLIYDYILNNDEAVNLQRFEIAWDISEHFGKVREELKRNIAIEIESRLSQGLDDNWMVINTFEEGYWNKHSAGIFLKNQNWVLNEHEILLGMQADGQEFHNLYVCFKYHNDISEYFENEFDDLESVKHWYGMKRAWIDETYRNTCTKDYFIKITTEKGKKEVVDYCVNKIYEFQKAHESRIKKIIK